LSIDAAIAKLPNGADILNNVAISMGNAYYLSIAIAAMMGLASLFIVSKGNWFTIKREAQWLLRPNKRKNEVDLHCVNDNNGLLQHVNRSFP
jgi:hypothetical protein